MIDSFIHILFELFFLFVVMVGGVDCFLYSSAHKHGLKYSVRLTSSHFDEHNIMSAMGIAAGLIAMVVFVVNLANALTGHAHISGGWQVAEYTAYTIAALNYKWLSRHFHQESLDKNCTRYYL